MLNVATQPTYKSLIGVGIYTVPEASRYTGVAAGKIKRWLKGYDYVQRGERRQAAPLWNPQIELDDGELHLGFRDLVELRVVNAFIEEGFSPWRVRQGLIAARTLAGDERPLSTLRFQTDGRTIFLPVAEETGDPHLIDIFSRQLAFRRILAACLRDIEFDRDLPVRWRIGGPLTRIVIDPLRSFGKPIDDATGVPVEVLAHAAIVEGSVEKAARAYAVPVRAVEQAAAFARRLTA
ncbi:MAG: hypothetical protein ACXW3U_11130 [Rhodoplanes sp.]